MTGKDIGKIGVAAAILVAAVFIYVRWGRSGAAFADDSVTYWYCTKANKAFQLSGKEYEDKVRTGRLMPEKGSEDEPAIQRTTDIVTMAKSPFSNDWTGIPAAKCEKCGEIFPLDTTGKKRNICPKCHWDPSHAPGDPEGGASKADD